MIKTLAILLLLLAAVKATVILTTKTAHSQQTLEPGWTITIYLPINPKDPKPNDTRNVFTIGPRHHDRGICRALLPALREHYKGASKIDCE